MDRRLWIAVGLAAAVGSPAFARGMGGMPPKPPWGQVVDPVKAAEVALRDVCLPVVIEGKALEPIAEAGRFARTRPKTVRAAPDDKVWQVGSIAPVYVLTRADGSCSALVNGGAPDLLRPAVEAAILARPEGFMRRQSGPDDAGRLERTTYCAVAGGNRFVVSVATPAAGAPRGTRALAATVSRAAEPACDMAPPGD